MKIRAFQNRFSEGSLRILLAVMFMILITLPLISGESSFNNSLKSEENLDSAAKGYRNVLLLLNILDAAYQKELESAWASVLRESFPDIEIRTVSPLQSDSFFSQSRFDSLMISEGIEAFMIVNISSGNIMSFKMYSEENAKWNKDSDKRAYADRLKAPVYSFSSKIKSVDLELFDIKKNELVYSFHDESEAGNDSEKKYDYLMYFFDISTADLLFNEILYTPTLNASAEEPLAAKVPGSLFAAVCIVLYTFPLLLMLLSL